MKRSPAEPDRTRRDFTRGVRKRPRRIGHSRVTRSVTGVRAIERRARGATLGVERAPRRCPRRRKAGRTCPRRWASVVVDSVTLQEVGRLVAGHLEGCSRVERGRSSRPSPRVSGGLPRFQGARADARRRVRWCARRATPRVRRVAVRFRRPGRGLVSGRAWPVAASRARLESLFFCARGRSARARAGFGLAAKGEHVEVEGRASPPLRARWCAGVGARAHQLQEQPVDVLLGDYAHGRVVGRVHDDDASDALLHQALHDARQLVLRRRPSRTWQPAS